MASCGCCEIFSRAKEPIEDGSCNGFAKATPKPIEYCPSRPGRKRHEYLPDSRTETYRRLWGEREEYTVTRHFKLCVHCGVERPVNQRWRKGLI